MKDFEKNLKTFLNLLKKNQKNEEESETVAKKLPFSPLFWLKYSLFKKKNYAFVLKCWRTGKVDLLFMKNPKEVVFSPEEKTIITRIYHYYGGHAWHVCVEGMPTNISLNQEIKMSHLSPHISSAIMLSHITGMLKGAKSGLRQLFSSPWVVLVFILLFLVCAVSAYFSYQAMTSVSHIASTIHDLNAMIAVKGV